MDDFKDDFWEWMEEKEYGKCETLANRKIYWIYNCQVHDHYITSIKSTKQMLIGYMMEYLREKKGKIILNIGGRATINDVYDRYVEDIEKME